MELCLLTSWTCILSPQNICCFFNFSQISEKLPGTMKLHFFQLNQWLTNTGHNLSVKHPGFSIVLTHLHPRAYFNTGIFFFLLLQFLFFFLNRIKKNARKSLLIFGYLPHAELSFLFKEERDCVCMCVCVYVCMCVRSGLFMGSLAW